MNQPPRSNPLSQRFKLRPDLQWSRYGTPMQPTWVARNPISLEYFYFSDIEKQILWLLNGLKTLAEVIHHPLAHSVGPEWVLQLVTKAQAANLLVAREGPGNGNGIWQAKQQAWRRGRLQWLLSPLAMRFKLFDPSRMLEFLAPLARALFSKWLAIFSLILIPTVAYFVVLRLNEIGLAQLMREAFGQLNAGRLLVLLIIYLGIKSLHELGHALACKKWQAECHEIGIFFLVFAPCLYCDTTDCWKLSNPWKRAAIAAAGIYVEVLVATLAGIVWLWTQPTSGLHWAAAYTMVIGSFSTVVVNANPLLRYDGYYILSDLWRVPNLADQSREALRAAVVWILTAKRFPSDRWDAHPWPLIAYQLAAKLYRTFLLVMIVVVVWGMLDRLGLRLVGMLLIAMTVTTALVGTALGAISLWKEVSMSGRKRNLRLWVIVASLCLLSWVILTVRWPTYVSARAVTALSELHPVYARQTGQLMEFSPLGQLVTPGQNLVRLQSRDLELELLLVEGQLRQLEEKLVQLRLAQVDDDQAAFELGDTVEQLAKHRAQRQILMDEISALQVLAEFDGRLIPSENRPQVTLSEGDHLGIWNPILAEAHLGATIERGTLLGWLAGGDSLELTAMVPEDEAERLRPGMSVVCRWDCQAGQIYHGKVLRISAEPLTTTPEVLLGDPGFVTEISPDGRAVPFRSHYEVEISVERFPKGACHQSLATVHVATAPSTLAEILYRFYSLHIRPQFYRQTRFAMNSSNMGSAIVCAVRSLSDSVNTWSSCP